MSKANKVFSTLGNGAKNKFQRERKNVQSNPSILHYVVDKGSLTGQNKTANKFTIQPEGFINSLRVSTVYPFKLTNKNSGKKMYSPSAHSLQNTSLDKLQSFYNFVRKNHHF